MREMMYGQEIKRTIIHSVTHYISACYNENVGMYDEIEFLE